MTKNNVLLIVDKMFWSLVYILPLIAFIIMLWHNPTTTSIESVFSSIGLGIVNDNIILTTLIDIFGAGGVFPIFTTNDFFIYLTYMSCVIILHLVVDFLLIIVRWAHSCLDKAVKE